MFKKKNNQTEKKKLKLSDISAIQKPQYIFSNLKYGMLT